VPTVLLLLVSWAAGLAAYAIAVVALRGEILSLDNWTIIGAITLVAWLVASLLVTIPFLRLLGWRQPVHRKRTFALVGTAGAVLPLWLNIGFWYGWSPRHLLIGEAGFLALHYATSGLVLSLALARRMVAPERERSG
jgi:hypothetical protein